MILGIIESIEQMGKNFQGWIIENSKNPLLWIGLFFTGVFIFFLTYNTLHKD